MELDHISLLKNAMRLDARLQAQVSTGLPLPKAPSPDTTLFPPVNDPFGGNSNNAKAFERQQEKAAQVAKPKGGKKAPVKAPDALDDVLVQKPAATAPVGTQDAATGTTAVNPFAPPTWGTPITATPAPWKP